MSEFCQWDIIQLDRKSFRYYRHCEKMAYEFSLGLGFELSDICPVCNKEIKYKIGHDDCIDEMVEKKSHNVPQKDPVHTEKSVRVLDLVMQDLKERADAGKEKYGRYLETHNGRSFEIDHYQELLDALMYIRGKIEEDKDRCCEWETCPSIAKGSFYYKPSCIKIDHFLIEQEKGTSFCRHCGKKIRIVEKQDKEQDMCIWNKKDKIKPAYSISCIGFDVYLVPEFVNDKNCFNCGKPIKINM